VIKQLNKHRNSNRKIKPSLSNRLIVIIHLTSYKNHFFEAMNVIRNDEIIHDEYSVLNIFS